MTGTIKRTTTNFALSIPYFNAPNWGQSFERNMDIIDAVLSTAGVVNNIVGPWANNTVYGVDDRVVDTTDNTVWQCAVAHTSAVSGTFAADRASNPTYWDAVTQNVVVRGAFVHGADYFVGDFVYDTSEVLGGIVITPFTGDTNLRNDIANIGVIFDLKADIAQWPTSTTALGYLRRNAGNTAYETRTPDEAANDLGLPLNTNVTALAYLRRNAGDTAYEARTPAETRADLDLDFYEADLGLTEEQQGQARANIGADVLGGFRNKLINGKFDIWQRGTSFAASGLTDVFVADRWRAVAGTGGSATITANPLFGGSENRNSLSWAQTVAASTGPYLSQRIEDVSTFSGKDVTLTFETIGAVAITVQPRIVQYFGSGGSASVVTSGTPISISASGKHTQKISIPSVAGKTVGAGDYLRVDLVFSTGVSFTAYLTKISLVEGDATAEADPFSPRHIQQELALCQRYYEVSSSSNDNIAVHYATNFIRLGRSEFKTKKRTTPTTTVTYGSGVWSSTPTVGALNNAGNDENGLSPIFAVTGGTLGAVGNVRYSWTADAEL